MTTTRILARPAFAVALLLFASAPRAEEFDWSLWKGVAVQQKGIIESLSTFASDRLEESLGDPRWDGREPIENVFRLIAYPWETANLPFLRIRHPRLVDLFGKNRVTPSELEAARERWLPLVPEDGAGESARIRSELIYKYCRMDTALRLEEKLAIVPLPDDGLGRPRVWLAPTAAPGFEEEWAILLAAYRAGDAKAFNATARSFVDKLAARRRELGVSGLPVAADRLRTEGRPFLLAAAVLAAGLLCAALRATSRSANLERGFARAETGLFVAGYAIMVGGAALVWAVVGSFPFVHLYGSALATTLLGGALGFAYSLWTGSRILAAAAAAFAIAGALWTDRLPPHLGSDLGPLVDAVQSELVHTHIAFLLAGYGLLAMAAPLVALAFLEPFARRFLPIRVPDAARLEEGVFRLVVLAFPLQTAGFGLGIYAAHRAWGRGFDFGEAKEVSTLSTWLIVAIYIHARMFLRWRGRASICCAAVAIAAVASGYLLLPVLGRSNHSDWADGLALRDWLMTLSGLDH